MGLPSVHLTEKPSAYTKEKLNACKSLDIHDQDLQDNNLSEAILSRLKLMMRYILHINLTCYKVCSCVN